VVFLRVHALYLSADNLIHFRPRVWCRISGIQLTLATELHCTCSAGYGCFVNGWQVSCAVLLKCLLCFPTWNIVTCILCMVFAMVMHVLLSNNTKGVFPIEGFRLEVFLREFTRHCGILVLFRVFLKGRW